MGLPLFWGMTQAQVLHKVVIEEFKPVFPEHVPEAYAELSRECWAKVPSARPTFEQACARLASMLELGSWMWASF